MVELTEAEAKFWQAYRDICMTHKMYIESEDGSDQFIQSIGDNLLILKKHYFLILKKHFKNKRQL